DRIGKNDAAMVEHFLKFFRCLPSASCVQIRLPPDIGGIEPSELGEERSAGHGKVIGKRRSQIIDRVQGGLGGECKKRAQRGKILELHGGVFRETLCQII